MRLALSLFFLLFLLFQLALTFFVLVIGFGHEASFGCVLLTIPELVPIV